MSNSNHQNEKETEARIHEISLHLLRIFKSSSGTSLVLAKTLIKLWTCTTQMDSMFPLYASYL